MNTLEQFRMFLQENGLRITKSRVAVAQVLIENTGSHLSPEEVFEKIQSSKNLTCDQVSVYRSLATFEKLGLVKKSSFQGDTAAKYVFNHSFQKSEAHSHEHYFKCISCKVIEPFKGCLVAKKEKELEQNGYRQLSHHLEITGLCPGCASNQ